MLERIPSPSTLRELLGQALFDVWQALCALVGLGVGLAVIKLLEPRLRQMRPDVRPCDKKEE